MGRPEGQAFAGAVRDRGARASAIVAVAAVLLVAGAAWLTGTTGDDPAAEPTAPAAAQGLPAEGPGEAPSGGTVAPGADAAPTLEPYQAPPAIHELSPTTVLVAETRNPALGRPVPDIDGTIWVRRAGGLANVDPVSGRASEWTIADDAAFAESFLAASAQGGVWLVGPDAVRLFDRERFLMVIELPFPVTSLAEAPDGVLWAAAGERGVIRWLDWVWVSGPPGRPAVGAGGVVADSVGRIWVQNTDPDLPDGLAPGLSAWDGTAWTTYTSDDFLMLRSLLPGIVPAADGSVWIWIGSTLGRFADGAWELIRSAGVVGVVESMAVAADGQPWVAGRAADAVTAVEIAALTDAGWLESAVAVGSGSPTVDRTAPFHLLSVDESIILAAAGGLWRHESGAWRSVWPDAGLVRATVQELVGVTGQEAWAMSGGTSVDEWWGWGPMEGLDLLRYGPDARRVRHLAWERVRDPAAGGAPRPDDAVRLALDGVGRLWVAGWDTLFYLQAGRWHEATEAIRLAVGQADSGCDRDHWWMPVLGRGPGDTMLLAGGPACDLIVRLSLGADGMSVQSVVPWTQDDVRPTSIVSTPGGHLWVLAKVPGWSGLIPGSIHRFDGVAWQEILGPTSDRAFGPIAVGPDGTVWTAAPGAVPIVATYADGQWRRIPVELGGRSEDGLEPSVVDLDVLADGRVLVGLPDAVLLYDGAGWATLLRLFIEPVVGPHPEISPDGIRDISVAGDGCIWVAGPNVFVLPPP